MVLTFKRHNSVSSQILHTLSLSQTQTLFRFFVRAFNQKSENGSGSVAHISITERQTDSSRLYNSLFVFFALSLPPCQRLHLFLFLFYIFLFCFFGKMDIFFCMCDIVDLIIIPKLLYYLALSNFWSRTVTDVSR